MQSEKLFEGAVQLACAFVANGDIRLGGSMSEDSAAMRDLADLIPSLYKMLYKMLPEASEKLIGHTLT